MKTRLVLATVLLFSGTAVAQAPESPTLVSSKIDVAALVKPIQMPLPPDYLSIHRDNDARVATEAVAEAARIAAAAEAARQAAIADEARTAAQIGSGGDNNYSFGNCTAWVAANIRVPNSLGNATNWTSGLLAAGWQVGAPRVGAVGVSHAGAMGHVVFAVALDGASVLISEMNYTGFNQIDQRVVGSGEFDWLYP